MWLVVDGPSLYSGEHTLDFFVFQTGGLKKVLRSNEIRFQKVEATRLKSLLAKVLQKVEKMEEILDVDVGMEINREVLQYTMYGIPDVGNF